MKFVKANNEISHLIKFMFPLSKFWGKQIFLRIPSADFAIFLLIVDDIIDMTHRKIEKTSDPEVYDSIKRKKFEYYLSILSKIPDLGNI